MCRVREKTAHLLLNHIHPKVAHILPIHKQWQWNVAWLHRDAKQSGKYNLNSSSMLQRGAEPLEGSIFFFSATVALIYPSFPPLYFRGQNSAQVQSLQGGKISPVLISQISSQEIQSFIRAISLFLNTLPKGHSPAVVTYGVLPQSLEKLTRFPFSSHETEIPA